MLRGMGITTALLVALVSSADAQPHGGTPPLPAGHRSSTSGVYTDAQAAKGADAYAGMCTGCHTTSAHVGDVFISNWSGRPVAEFFGFIRSAMPKTDPGSLSDDEYVAIVAFILKLNGLPAGKDPLPADSAALHTIRFDPPKKGP